MKRLAFVALATAAIGLWATPSSAQTVVTAGAFCAPLGATGATAAGTAMVCSVTAAAPTDQPRWRDASTPGLLTVLPGVSDAPTTTIAPTPAPTPVASAATVASQCDPSYPDFCIPSPPPDLDCADILPQFSIHVLPPDPHGFDGDHDGIGCEGNAPATTAPAPSAAGTIVATNALPRTGNTTGKAVAIGSLALLLGASCLRWTRHRRLTRLP